MDGHAGMVYTSDVSRWDSTKWPLDESRRDGKFYSGREFLQPLKQKETSMAFKRLLFSLLAAVFTLGLAGCDTQQPAEETGVPPDQMERQQPPEQGAEPGAQPEGGTGGAAGQ